MSRVISLGCNCNPRIYLKNKLNLSKENGYKSCPFDLCITPFQSLCNILSNDFLDFFNDLNHDNAHITNKHLVIFNHEAQSHCDKFNEGKNDPEYFTRDNYNNFKKRYNDRIQNFRDYLKNSESVLFVYESHYDKKKAWTNSMSAKFDENKIAQIILKTYGNKNISFLDITKYE